MNRYSRGRKANFSSKLIINMRLFGLRDDVARVLREEQCAFRKGRGCVDEIFTLRIIIEK